MSNELWRKTALELASDIRSGAATSREVLEAHLDRVSAINPHVNAIVRLMADDARAAADAADAAVKRGDTLGPLHGVPITVKENIDIAGLPTTQGIPLLAEAIPPTDAPIVELMKEAGAIPFARTNLPDLGLRVHTDSTLYGRTKNPWSQDRTAGGSSGGEGAALASGMSPLGLGNDIGGSLRNPAHACGIASIKPTVGAIADAQYFPEQDRGMAAQTMLTQGVMARRIADVRAGFLAVAGQHPRDPLSVPARFADLTAGEKVKIAVLADPPGGTTHPDVAAAVRSAADVLSNLGHDVVEATPPEYEKTLDTWGQMMSAELRAQIDLLKLAVGDNGWKLLEYSMEVIPDVSFADYLRAQMTRDGLTRQWQMWFEEYPVLLTPTWTQPPFVYDFDIADRESAAATLDLMRPVKPANVLGLPAVVVPHGRAEELPVGVQVMGTRFSDLRCLTIAEMIEASQPSITPIDPDGL
jgi:amidase